MSERGCQCSDEAKTISQKSVLITLLVINGLMFFIEISAGILADSTGLIADSLDMLADALVYGLALYAVGHPPIQKIRAAFWSGIFQIGLAGLVVVDILRRIWLGSEPHSLGMFAVSSLALMANIYCLKLITRERHHGVHMRASWIFSRNDVLANAGVLLASGLVWLSQHSWPDLVIGALIAGIVFRGGLQILGDTRQEMEKECGKWIWTRIIQRRTLYRAIALGLVPSLWLVAEVACQLFGWGNPTGLPEVDRAFLRGHSLFVKNEEQSRYEIRPERRKFFVEETFPIEKVPGTFRVFCLGGSTVQGRPFGKETSFTTWLELGLSAAQPSINWEVINCGGVSYGTRRLRPIVEECLEYDPDLIILCTGHNEFLERTPGNPNGSSGFWQIVSSWMMENSRVVRISRKGWARMIDSGEEKPVSLGHAPFSDVDAFLDYRDGLAAYHRDPAWHREVIHEFEENMRWMLQQFKADDVPVLVLTPPSNLRDSPPFKSEHGKSMASDQKEEWDHWVRMAADHMSTNLSLAIDALQRARKLDGKFAEIDYRLGRAHLALAQPGSAREAFLRARDQDICPLRILSSMEEILAEVSQELDVPHLNLHEELEKGSVWEILGNDWLADHVHPTIRGHQRIARRVLDVMVDMKLFSAIEGWETVSEKLQQEHYATLDMLYFARGQQRLENLKAWTQGKTDGPPLSDKEGIDQEEDRSGVKH